MFLHCFISNSYSYIPNSKTNTPKFKTYIIFIRWAINKIIIFESWFKMIILLEIHELLLLAIEWYHPISTHWGRDKMAAISQTMFSNAFSWMKMYEYCLRFLWNVFLRIDLTIFQQWFRQWLGAEQVTSHCLNQWCLDYRRIYVSLGLNELTRQFLAGLLR